MSSFSPGYVALSCLKQQLQALTTLKALIYGF